METLIIILFIICAIIFYLIGYYRGLDKVNDLMFEQINHQRKEIKELEELVFQLSNEKANLQDTITYIKSEQFKI